MKMLNIINEEIDIFSKAEKRRRLKNNEPIIVYRGISKTGKNFYKGNAKLPYTYYTLSKETASKYGIVNQYAFNKDSQIIKILHGAKFFDMFGLNADPENPEVIEKIKQKNYDLILMGDKIILYNESLIFNTPSAY